MTSFANLAAASVTGKATEQLEWPRLSLRLAQQLLIQNSGYIIALLPSG